MPLPIHLKPVLLNARQPMRAIEMVVGMRENLQCVLDAGDAASAPSSATSWLDLSGNGQDFFLGTTGGADANDPSSFQGQVGRCSINEYWSMSNVDPDCFRYDSANETWMENIHKDNAKFTIVLIPRFNAGGGGANGGYCGTRGAAAGRTGFHISHDASNFVNFQVTNAGTSVISVTSTRAVLTANRFTFVAVSVDEASGTGIMQVNDLQQDFTSTYSSPAAGAASSTMELCTRGNLNTPEGNGDGMAGFFAWDRNLQAHELRNLYRQARIRWGIQANYI